MIDKHISMVVINHLISGYFVLFCTILSTHTTMADRYASMSDLEGFIKTEFDLLMPMRTYIQSKQVMYKEVEDIANEVEHQYRHISRDMEYHLGNPVNAYHVIKLLTKTAKLLEGTAIAMKEDLHRSVNRFLDDEDMKGISSSFNRLLDTYQLPASYIVQADFPGVARASNLTSEDCFTIAVNSYNTSDFYHALIWFNETMNLLNVESDPKVLKTTLLPYLTYTYYVQGNIPLAGKYNSELLKLDPDHSMAQKNDIYFKTELAAQREGQYSNWENGRDFKDETPSEMLKYEKLCRGERTKESPSPRHLYCTYNKLVPDLYYVAPLREEVVSLSPFIALYHNVITDSEIAKVKELAVPLLFASRVNSVDASGKYAERDSPIRTSQQAWLQDHFHPVIGRLSQKAGELSNLSIKTSEYLQVVNYASGGHYTYHVDHTKAGEIPPPWHVLYGNRIATVLFYMHDTKAGGHTVFPNIGVSVKPEKGACVVWYNLRKNGDGDGDTLHAACPVLAGTKWICNKWFHAQDQEFRRPCSLSKHE